MLITSHRKPNLLSLVLFKFIILHFSLELIKQSFIHSVKCMAFDHCYSDIGCFPLRSEFYHPRHRPFNVRPWHRRRIKIYFELYSRQHPEGFVLRSWNKYNLKASQFNPLLETKIIVPGWLDNIKRALWVKRMKDAFLWLWHPVNIIVVHWRNFTPYTIATANTRVVGAELANLLKSIEHELNYDRNYYHLIGHSLGAHISGYCGDIMPGLGRITALDPARPFFQHMPKSVRLDRQDAKFVDAIHSDFTPENAIFLIMSFGMTTPVGHLDFYPNGPPLLQAGCLRDSILSIRNGIQRGIEHNSLSVAFLESVRYLTACDHQRSHEWFIESITNRQCVFIGVRCSEFNGLINGECTCDSSRSACAMMGIHADQMYLNKLHDDIWPINQGRGSALIKPSQAPFALAPNQERQNMLSGLAHFHDNRLFSEQLTRPSIVLKEQLYSEMKHNANKLRYPPEPQYSAASALIDDIVSVSSLEKIIEQDEDLMNYLKSNFHHPDQRFNHEQQQLQKPRVHFSNSYAGRNTLKPLDDNHDAMSDLDRDIEQWYENTSRWYLKTNNKPSYCANQYQVLVYLGPLKTSNGHKRLRANLILSIVGSKGQLLNQRFVPRAKTLDSFTMQPFFILLEGSYSLGNILWVAVGWEARYDIDPIQATISFQSNMLESMQSFIPYTYQAKHPWLSETLKYDHSKAFRWSGSNAVIPKKAVGDNNHLLSHLGVDLEKRSSPPKENQGEIKEKQKIQSLVTKKEGCLQKDGQNDGHCSYVKDQPDDEIDLNDLEDINRQIEDLLSGESSEIIFDRSVDYYSGDASTTSKKINRSAQQLARPRERYSNRNPNFKTNHMRYRTSHEPWNQHVKMGRGQIDSSSIGQVEPHKRIGSDITAELNNIGVNLDRGPEDIIIVSKVVISPLQAHYGKKTTKVSSTFCPPHQNFPLRRDQTVRLEARLIGRCGSPNFPTHYPHPVIDDNTFFL